MARRCAEGQYLDRLLRECVSCGLTCHNPVILSRCSEHCAAWSCAAEPGQFYDQLLKKCLKCSELCGRHPSCSDACQNAAAVTPGPAGGSAVPLVTSRGRSAGRSALDSLSSEALLYSLLGVCACVLMFTLTAAILMLLQRAKQQPQPQPDSRKQQPSKHGQSSKDSLVSRADEVCEDQDRPRATETCVYCFSECEHTAGPHTLFQQAGEPLHTHTDKSRPFRIICSPTQTSM